MNSISLFDEIKKGGYETCLASTYNIDFPFYEEVLLRRMRAAGIQHHVLLIDSTMCLQAMESRPPRMAGRQYTLAPMACKGAFHPKLIMLLGKHKGLLAVGSHNLTLSGFGTNLEITNFIRFNAKDDDSTAALITRGYDAFLDWFDDYGKGLPQEIRTVLAKTEDLYDWLKKDITTGKGPHLLYSTASSESLWNQLLPLLPDKIETIFGISPFFDKACSIVHRLRSLAVDKVILGVQPELVQASDALLKIDGVEVKDSSCLNQLINSNDYIHAKILYFKSTGSRILLSGSANLSAPAWLGEQPVNAEAVLVRVDTQVTGIVEALGLEHLEVAEVVDCLPETLIEESESKLGSVKILLIPFESAKDVSISITDIKYQQSLDAGYKGELGKFEPLTVVLRNKILTISCKDVRQGEILLLYADNVLWAKVILHNILEIRKTCSTGVERKLRQALASLATDAPDIKLLFRCIDSLTQGKFDQKRIAASRNSRASEKSTTAADSLISGVADHTLNRLQSIGRYVDESDIGMILDILSNSYHGNESTEHEEQLEEAGIDQTENAVVSPIATIAKLHKGDELPPKESVQLCNGKFNNTLQRLNTYLDVNGINGITGALGLSLVAHHIHINLGHQGFLTQEALTKLFQIICAKLLTDKDPFYDSSAQDAVRNSEEWGKLIGYCTWLSYHAGIQLRGRLPLSATKNEKDELLWSNACWLYFNQHLQHDRIAKEKATELCTAGDNPDLRSWYSLLTLPIDAEDGKVRKMINGFKIARSPKNAYSGVRLVVEEEGGKFTLASIAAPGRTTNFQSNALVLKEGLSA